jgi:TolB protein
MSRRDRPSVGAWTRREWLGLAAAGVLGGGVARAVEDKERPSRLFFRTGSISPRNRENEPFIGFFAVDPETALWDKLTPKKSIASWASVAPDGRSVAYYERGANEGRGVWVVDLAGDRAPKQVLEGSCPSIVSPRWSADGKELIVCVNTAPQGEGPRFRAYRMMADGVGKAELPVAETDLILDWSPDGQWLLVASGRDRPGDLPARDRWPVDLVKLDGTGRRRLVEGGMLTNSGRFAAPEGRSVSYVQLVGEPRKLREVGLWTVDVDGRNRRRILSSHDEEAPLRARWSPDGKHLAVTVSDALQRDTDGNIARELEYHLEIMDPDGSHRRRLDLPHSRPDLIDWR